MRSNWNPKQYSMWKTVSWCPISCENQGKQNSDGGWGEDFSSCFNREYAARDKLYGLLFFSGLGSDVFRWKGIFHHQQHAGIWCRIQGCDSGSTVVQTSWALLALMAGDCQEIDVCFVVAKCLLMKLFFPKTTKALWELWTFRFASVGFRSHSTRNQSALAAPTPFWRLGPGEYCRSVRDPGQWSSEENMRKIGKQKLEVGFLCCVKKKVQSLYWHYAPWP